MWGQEKEELKALDEFLMEKIGITSSQLVGHVATFKRDTEVSMRVTTQHSLTINIQMVIKADTEIKILRPCCCSDMKFRSMKDNVIFEITNPQIIVEQLDLSIKQFVDAITE